MASLPAVLAGRYRAEDHQPSNSAVLADDLRNGQQVTLTLVANADPQARRAFVEQARRVQALRHPRLAALLEVGEEEGVAFAVARRPAGTDLRAWLDRAPPTVEEALRVASAIARALQAAHEAGLVHRDLRPENVVIGPEGDVTVLHVGVGASAASSPYAAPELSTGIGVDHRVDLYAFGGILYEMLTGEPPVTGVPGGARPPSSVHANVPVWLDGVVARCLARESVARYPDARSLLVDLERSQFGLRADRDLAPLALPRLPSAPPVPGLAWPIGWTVAFVLVVLGLLVAHPIFHGAPLRPRRRPRRRDAVLTGRTDLKFQVPLDRFARLLAWLDRTMKVETYGHPVCDFINAGFYYDTPRFDSYADTLMHRQLRWRLRTRVYLTPGGRNSPIYLEGKRHVDGVLFKERTAVDSLRYDPRRGLPRGARATDGGAPLAFLGDLLYQFDPVPVAYVGYVRRAYSGMVGGGLCRVTVDTDARYFHGSHPTDDPWELHDASIPLNLPFGVVERKSLGDPTEFDRRVQVDFLGVPRSISKYFAAVSHRLLGDLATRDDLLEATPILRRLLSCRTEDPAWASVIRALAENLARSLEVGAALSAGDGAAFDEARFLARNLDLPANKLFPELLDQWMVRLLETHARRRARAAERTPPAPLGGGG